ncbi:uncharacterized protein SCHCODRAFT_02602402 [Schizophyllum commune H4-8]|uniref:Uncharacterized protein n=1 Tax=Schizophyllum commune (strain H4-8 / FGSC 9210) TaxID=578458 RepID=D8QFT5_SCHCM|nr:uncharacterized protein SCHCODRAFT_02602402 [Schizophyllum commune H4-8]KAI5887776.1 hypothetical protein SCHCODRAFT_02602402 [Schizophyllum commune H4-8]
MPVPTSTHRPPPRPILKASHSAGPPSTHSHLQPPHERAFPTSSSGPPTPSRGVHFPPSPRLTRTFSAHPPSDYDRSPIVVAPNTCALPERFGRVYTGEEDKATARSARSPRVENRGNGYGFPTHPQYGYAPCPPLTPDASSESDDSDACASPPPDLVVAGAHSLPSLSGAHTVSGPRRNAGAYTSRNAYPTPDAVPISGAHSIPSLAFLPHAPKSARHGPASSESEDEDDEEGGRAPTPTPRSCNGARIPRSGSSGTIKAPRRATPSASGTIGASSTTRTDSSNTRTVTSTARTDSSNTRTDSPHTITPRKAGSSSAPNSPRRRRKPVSTSSFSMAEEDCLGGF